MPLISRSEEKKTNAKILSQYCSDAYDDVHIPCINDYILSLGNMYVGSAKAPLKLKSLSLRWNQRISAACFRGGATGAGVTKETNPRLNLCSLSKTWSIEDPDNILIDAKLTSWNGRHKRGSDFVIRVIDPDTAAAPLTWDDAGYWNKLTMEEQARWKYYVYLDGNVGASRLGELAIFNFLVLMPPSVKPQVDHYKLLIPWVHFIPLQTDLSDLKERIIWCQNNDAQAEQIASNFYTTLIHRMHKQNIESRVSTVISSLPSPAMSILEDFKIMWEIHRAGIYCLAIDDELRIFIPFANPNFRNRWDINEIKFEPSPKEKFLDESQRRFGKEKVIPNIKAWWDNGGLICNVMPKYIWGTGMLVEFHYLLTMGLRKYPIITCS